MQYRNHIAALPIFVKFTVRANPPFEAMKMAADAGEALPLIEKAMRLNTRYAEMYYRAKNNENAEN